MCTHKHILYQLFESLIVYFLPDKNNILIYALYIFCRIKMYNDNNNFNLKYFSKDSIELYLYW